VVRAPQDFSHTLDWGLRLTLVIALPATVGLVLLAGPILATLFMYGEFTRHDVNMTALSLACYAVGLLGFILVKILAPGFYARHDTRTPVRIGVIAIGVNMVLTLAFVVPLEVLNIPGSHAGLALATAIAAYVNAGLLLLYLRRTGVYVPRRGWRRLHLQLLLANIAMGLLLWFGVPQMEAWVQWTSGARVAALGTWIAVAMLVYLSVLKLTGVDFAGLLRPKRIEHGTDSRSA
jgi:putative peptidoglycan lipid II flippase